MVRSTRVYVLRCLLCSLPATAAFPQATTTGVIKGTIEDATSGVLPGVTVTISGPSLVGALVTVTGPEGNFQLLRVPVGVVELRAELLGFEPAIVREIVVNPGSTQTYDLVLNPGGLSEEVTVIATPPLIDQQNVANKTTVDANYTNITPLLDRNYQEVTTLFPGVHKEDTPPTFVPFGVFGGIHIRGSRDRNGGFRVDGAALNDPYEGATFMNINQNAIERFELISGGYQPEYGEQSGGIVNLVTKSGGSEYRYHAGAFYRNDALASDLPANLPGQILAKAPQTKQFYELSAGGPLKQDKADFFAAIDIRDFGEGTVFTPRDVKTDTSSVFGNAKVNFVQSEADTWTFSFFFEDSRRDRARLGNGILPEASFDFRDRGVVGIARQTHVFSPDLVLESQLLVNDRRHQRLQSEPDAGPNVVVINADGSTLETGAYFAPQDYDYTLFRVSETVTKAGKKLLVKAGLDYSFISASGETLQDHLFIDLRPIGTDAAFRYDFGLGRYDYDEHEAAAYVQGNYNPNQNLTVEGGVRLDYQSLVGDAKLSPRIGLSADPTGAGTTKIFANWGIFYDYLFFRFFNIPTRVDLSRRIDNCGQNNLVLSPRGPNLEGAGEIRILDMTCFLDDVENPYWSQYNVGIERTLKDAVKLSANFTYSRGFHQEFLEIIPDPRPDRPQNHAVPFTTSGNARYRGLELLAQSTPRTAGKLRYSSLLSWTISRAQGSASTFNAIDTQATKPEDPLSALQGFDRTHVVTLTGIIGLPGDVNVSPVYRYLTGQPYNIFANTTIFAAEFAPGTTRNGQRKPSKQSLDLTAEKLIPLGGKRLKLVLQAFNLTNRVNVEDVFLTGPLAGRPTFIGIPRTFQLGVELDF